MAILLAPVNARVVLQCNVCLLVQFQSSRNVCRRCHLSLDDEPEPAPEPAPPAAMVPQEATGLTAALAKNLRAARLRLNLSQRELAARLGSPRTYVSKLENLRAVPTIGNLGRLAVALETSILALLSGGERSRRDEVDELMKNSFIKELLPYIGPLTELQRRAILVAARDLALPKRIA